MRKIIITISQFNGRPGCEGCAHRTLITWCTAFRRTLRVNKYGSVCRLRACTAGEQKLKLLERKAASRG